jgi:hypothetical protein
MLLKASIPREELNGGVHAVISLMQDGLGASAASILQNILSFLFASTRANW